MARQSFHISQGSLSDAGKQPFGVLQVPPGDLPGGTVTPKQSSPDTSITPEDLETHKQNLVQEYVNGLAAPGSGQDAAEEAIRLPGLIALFPDGTLRGESLFHLCFQFHLH